MIETAEVMSDNLLANIIVLDVSEQSDYFNYFIIATGLTSQHLESSGNTVTKHLKNLNIKINHKEVLLEQQIHSNPLLELSEETMD